MSGHIFPGRDCYFYEPKQVFFITKSHIEYIKGNFLELIDDLYDYYPEIAETISKEGESIINYIKLGLMTGQYYCGIAYKDEVIGSDKNSYNLKEIKYFYVLPWDEYLFSKMYDYHTVLIVKNWGSM